MLLTGVKTGTDVKILPKKSYLKVTSMIKRFTAFNIVLTTPASNVNVNVNNG